MGVTTMVGGTVIETIVLDDVVWVDCAGYEASGEGGQTCAITVENTAAARCISAEDSIWWHGTTCYWTPATRAFKDHRLRKVGYSGVPHPLVERALEKLGVA